MRLNKITRRSGGRGKDRSTISQSPDQIIGCSKRTARIVTSLVFCCALTSVFAYSTDAGASLIAEPQDQTKLKDAEFISAGAKLFAPTCGSGYCHGAGGMGGGAPRIRNTGLDPAFAFKRISEGAPGTAMMGFKEQFKPEEIWKLVAFVLSPVGKATDAKPNAVPARDTALKPASLKPDEASRMSEITGDQRAGRAIFFDSANQQSCHVCHVFQDSGTPIGPDLSKAPAVSAREIFLSIILPHDVTDPRFVKLTMSDGETIQGVKKEEDGESVRVYDVTSLPAVLRTLRRENIGKIEPMKRSPMPADYSSRYTIKQLLDLVAFLKSADSQVKPVTLKDLF